MTNLESKLIKFLKEFGRVLYDVTIPVAGDIDMYNKRTKKNLPKKEALMDIAPTPILKYMVLYGSLGRVFYNYLK